jgi:hypothetical protein
VGVDAPSMAALESRRVAPNRVQLSAKKSISLLYFAPHAAYSGGFGFAAQPLQRG